MPSIVETLNTRHGWRCRFDSEWQSEIPVSWLDLDDLKAHFTPFPLKRLTVYMYRRPSDGELIYSLFMRLNRPAAGMHLCTIERTVSINGFLDREEFEIVLSAPPDYLTWNCFHQSLLDCKLVYKYDYSYYLL